MQHNILLKKTRYIGFLFSATLAVAFFLGISCGYFIEEWRQEFEQGISVPGVYSMQVKGATVSADDTTEQLEDTTAQLSIENILPISEYKLVKKGQFSDLVVPNAHSAVILDVHSGTILHYQNAKNRRQIASLTKIMTGLLVMEHVKDLNVSVTITKEMLSVDGTVVGCPRSGYCPWTRFREGEKIRVVDLMKAMLMNSANDAATALGIYVGGTMENFVNMMNARAKNIGLQDTHFCTPSGLEIDGHEKSCYSTAYDIARIAAQTVQYDEMWKYLRHPETEIFSADGKITHKIITTNELIGKYPNLLGTKTGFTPNSGHSLLAVADDASGQHSIVAVALDDPYRWKDIQDMMNWAFRAYEWL